MAFEDYLDDRCDIFHVITKTVGAGYGIRQSIVKQTQIKEAAESDVPCHFHFNRNNTSLRQDEPYSAITGTQKVSFGPETDIRLNDMIRDCSNGLYYRVGPPRYVHGKHHIVAEVQREDGVKGAL